ncbi:MAG: hypothetical protein KAS47_03070 [Candidatus Heimdallarchaeota archaeon]|nr:hypothetical protein [Candidatus Heimdallarchaeota archaeon]
MSTSLYQKYVQTFIDSCKKDNSFVVMLKWNTIEEAHEKIKQKCILIQTVGNLIEKYQFGKTFLSYYKTGKIMLTEVDHIETLLEKLFS